MPIDDSFKKPGAVPFHWEIRPGVPKHYQPNHIPSPPTTNPHNLKPPPATPPRFHFPYPLDSQICSLKSAQRTKSDRFLSNKPPMAGPEVVSLGCFLARKGEKWKTNKLHAGSSPEPTCKSDLETLAEWSMSTQMSRSPFRDSPLSSSFSSYRSSPRMVSDAEWAGFGLF